MGAKIKKIGIWTYPDETDAGGNGILT